MKALNYIYIILFVALLVTPVGLGLVMPSDGTSEKRELAAFPGIFTDDGINENLADDIDAYLRDHSAFRTELVGLRSHALARLGQSALDTVILGTDGWLYYGAEAEDYLNIPSISEKTALNIAKTYGILSEVLESRGTSFVFAVAPNKSSLYPYLPGYYTPHETGGNMELLLEAFDKVGVNYADLTKALTESSAFTEGSVLLYQKTDTHWTYEGALLAYRSIMEASGLEFNSFDGLSFSPVRDWQGDLAVMLYSKAEPDIQQYPDLDFSFEYTSREKNPDALLLTTANRNGRGNLLVFRDSFCNTMHKFFAENSETAVFSRAVPYDLEAAPGQDPDLVVAEIVERNIANLSKAAPVIRAPLAKISDIAETADPGLVTVKTRESSGLVHFYGFIDDSFSDDDREIYILLFNGEKELAYRAFPIFEEELLSSSPEVAGYTANYPEKHPEENGFSAYISAGNVTDMKVAVLIKSGGKLYCAEQPGEELSEERFTKGFVDRDGKLYYVDMENAVPEGPLEYDGREYYLNGDGSLYYGWLVTDDGRRFYSSDTGERVTGEALIDGKTYYFNNDGTAVTGWFELSGYRYYDSEGVMQTGLTELPDGTYYLGDDGVRQTGFVELPAGLYFFDEDGKAFSGWKETEEGRMYFGEELTALDGWQEIDLGRYYFVSRIMQTGWQTLEEDRYYFNDGKMSTGFVTIDGNNYYFDGTGRMLTGTQVIDGVTYTFAADGTSISGWQTIDGVRYYYTGGQRRTGFMLIDGVQYYFGSDGAMKTGFVKIDGATYYFNDSGAMKTGFVTVSGDRYLFASNGKMLTGWQTVSGKTYYFYSDGKMARNTGIGEYYFDSEGVGTFRFSVITRENLSAYIEYILDKNGRSLEAVFNYCGRKNFSYFYRSPASDVEGMAIDMFNTGKGSCYEFSAITYLCAKALGYNCMIVTGKGAYYEVHKWVLIEVSPGVWRHMDTERSSLRVYLVTDAQLEAWNGISSSIRYEWDRSKYPAAN